MLTGPRGSGRAPPLASSARYWHSETKQHPDMGAALRCGEKPNALPVKGSVGLLVWRVTRGYTPAGFCAGSRPSAKELASRPVQSRSCLKHNRRARFHWAELNRMQRCKHGDDLQLSCPFSCVITNPCQSQLNIFVYT